MIVWGDEQTNDDLRRWTSFQIWLDPSLLEKGRAMAVIIDDALAAVMVFHNWNPRTGVVEITGASINKRWMSRKVLQEMGQYAFDHLGMQAVVMKTSPKDKPLLRILKACGFKSYVIPRLRGKNEAEVIHTLTVEDWRNTRFGKHHVKS